MPACYLYLAARRIIKREMNSRLGSSRRAYSVSRRARSRARHMADTHHAFSYRRVWHARSSLHVAAFRSGRALIKRATHRACAHASVARLFDGSPDEDEISVEPRASPWTRSPASPPICAFSLVDNARTRTGSRAESNCRSAAGSAVR